jgi:predicted SAM-dependent methyltransferase
VGAGYWRPEILPNPSATVFDDRESARLKVSTGAVAAYSRHGALMFHAASTKDGGEYLGSGVGVIRSVSVQDRVLSSLAARLPTRLRRVLGRYRRKMLRLSSRTPTGARATRTVAPEPAAPVTTPAPAQTPAPAGTVAPNRLEVRRQRRRDFVFATADPKGSVLEIGPAHYGILPKRDGFNTKTVDYLDRAGLVEKYREFQQYSPDDIEEVDFVLPPGASMADVISERFDLVLASHVLEHTTSVIDFLADCTKLLTDRGVIALVVPDHRYCFDRFRERSSLGRIIDASLNPPPVHTVGTLTEFTLNAVKHRGETSWSPGHQGNYELIHSLAKAKENGEEARGETYIDVHNWIFTPHYLRLLLQDLWSLELISVREAFFHDTVGHEFFINLTVDAPGSGLSREQLLVLADEERRGMDVPAFEDAPQMRG